MLFFLSANFLNTWMQLMRSIFREMAVVLNEFLAGKKLIFVMIVVLFADWKNCPVGRVTECATSRAIGIVVIFIFNFLQQIVLTLLWAFE